mgnify:CR=1 FL=1
MKINIRQLKLRCSQTIEQLFTDLGGVVRDGYAFRDNGSNILAVAHCDTVCHSEHFAYDNGVVFNAKLDDRLGVYTIMDLLPALGCKVDVLLTDGEEIGASTAANFNPAKIYNWIVEFDRRGEGAVLYQYTGFTGVVRKHFTLEHGSYSDISSMGHIGCMALNVGIGYHDEHMVNCYADLNEYTRNINRFIKFYEEQRDIFHEFIPVKRSFTGWDDLEFYRSKSPHCPQCNEESYTRIDGGQYCHQCGIVFDDDDDCWRWKIIL